MAAIYPPRHVDAPPAGPLRYGLFNAARLTPGQPIDGVGGVQFEPDTCGTGTLYTAECPITDQNAKTFGSGITTMTTAPFWVNAGIVCAPVGRTIGEQERRAQQALYAAEQTQVESAYWTGGGVGAAPALTTAVGVVTPALGGLTQFGAILSLMEATFYSLYGYQGTIHVNYRAMGAAAFGNLLIRPDQPDVPRHLTTPDGSIWSFGAGYGITGPLGVAAPAGTVWAFMTGPVTVWQGDVRVPPGEQTFDRINNQAYAIAERAYNVSHDCPTIVAVPLPLEAP